jgi:ferrous iron transport protein B
MDGTGLSLNHFTPRSGLSLCLLTARGGIQAVSSFIPVVFAMFFMLALLEDSGYMARAAFIMDRFMRFIGLPGKAFLPLMIGFGCSVPQLWQHVPLRRRGTE